MKRKKVIPVKRFLTERYGLLIVLALMLAYSAYFSALSIQRHNSFRTQASDMGQMDQALWNTLHGNLLEDTRPNGQNLPRLTDHVEPIFLVIPFVFVIYDGIESLFVVQSIAIALGALAIYWIARRRLRSESASVVFAAMYLLFPALEAANLAEFHAVTFAPAPLMFAYNYGQERAWKRYALFALIALAVKEEIALLVFTMAVYFAIQSTVHSLQSTEKTFTFHVSRFTFRLRCVPLIIAAISLACFFIAVFIIIPHFSIAGQSPYVNRYDKTPMAIILGLLTPEKLAYLAQLLASVGFIAIFDPLSLLVGSSSLILNLLSNYPAQYSGTYHYSAPVAPYFVLAAIGGAAALQNSKFKVRNSLVILPAFVIALGYHALAGYTPFGGEFFWPPVTPHQQLLARFTNQIPHDVPAMTTSSLYPHLSHRRVLYRFGQLPIPADTQYILLDVSQATTNPIDYVSNYRDALKQGFGIRDALDGYILLQRSLAQKELPDEFYNYLRVCSCTVPQNRVGIDFDNKLRFLGYDIKQDDWQRVYLRTYWTRLAGLDNNFALYPFFPDDNGAPRADAPLPDLMFPFWYPTLKWKEGEIIAIETIPIELGARAKIGLGVFFGATWDDAEFYLKPYTTAPISLDGRWVLIGEIVQNGKKYEVVSQEHAVVK